LENTVWSSLTHAKRISNFIFIKFYI